MDGASARIQREIDVSIAGAWHAANLSRAKKMPKLADYLPDRTKKAARVMAPEEIQAALSAWVKVRAGNG